MARVVSGWILVMVLMIGVAMAAPDPWRVVVSDYAAYGPTLPDAWWASPLPGEGGAWSGAGGSFRAYRIFGRTQLMTFSRATGQISFGTWVDMSVEGIGRPAGTSTPGGGVCQVRTGSIIKALMNGYDYTGMEVRYTSSIDGINFAAVTRCTIYGSTITSTGIYGVGGAYLSASGAYLMNHSNSYNDSIGLATSGLGETVWYDIDTGGLRGDPLAPPGGGGVTQYGNQARACDGNLIFPRSTCAPVDWGLGLAIGAAGELCGGDDYVWVADTTSASTVCGPSLLSGIGLLGLSGPSTRVAPNWVTGWPSYVMGLAPSPTDTPTAFLLLYDAVWDTDSSGAGYDAFGGGHAVLLLSRNKADFNLDGTVNFQDIGPFSGAYGSKVGEPAYSAAADFNGDGEVNFQDIGPLSGRYGTDCSYDGS